MFGERPLPAIRAATLCLAVICFWHALPLHSASDAVASKLTLAESERVYIAQIETRGLTLNQKGFPALARALRTGELAHVKHFLAPNFSGAVMPFPEKPNFQNDIL